MIVLRKLASHPTCTLTGCLVEGHNTELGSQTARLSQWNTPLSTKDPTPIWTSVLPSAISSHAILMKESHNEASSPSTPLLSRSREDAVLYQGETFLEPLYRSSSLPSVMPEHNYVKEASYSFDIPNSSGLVDSEMLETIDDTDPTVNENKDDMLEDCQILVSCIFEFLQTTQPRRYELQAQLTVICEDLLRVIRTEKEKRVVMARETKP